MEEDVIKKNSIYKLIMYLVGAASIFIVLFGIKELSSIINPILLAIVITMSVLPIHTYLSKHGLGNWLSLILTILMVVGILGFVLVIVFVSITKMSIEIPAYLAQFSDQISDNLSVESLNSLGLNLNSIQNLAPIIEKVVGIVITFVTQFGITLLIFVFMIIAAISLRKNAKTDLKIDDSILSKINDITADVRKYVNTLTFINLLVGIGNVILLMILGVPYALLWGILSWFMGYIPAIGFIIALIPPVILGYIYQGPETAIIITIGYILINGGVQNLIQPKLMGDKLSISPVIVFISIFFWGYLLGGIGVLLCIPLTLIVILILENVHSTQWIAALMRYNGSNEQKKEEKQAIQKVKKIAEKVNPFDKK